MFKCLVAPRDYLLILYNSHYASQVVIICKKSWETCLCMDYRKLSCITIWEKALQVVHNINVFTSFDLAQGYLQLAMKR